jgi:hypothetical protein
LLQGSIPVKDAPQNVIQYSSFSLHITDRSKTSKFTSLILILCITYLCAQLEYAHYLEDSETDLSMLNKYPNVRRVFIRYNTMIPSSGPVERLFSFGGMIHSAKRNRLSDKTFETLLLLKANQSFCNKLQD